MRYMISKSNIRFKLYIQSVKMRCLCKAGSYGNHRDRNELSEDQRIWIMDEGKSGES